jgi:predicted metal-dependent hydrolase
LISPVETPSEPDVIDIHSHRMPIVYRRHARARNYVLRLHFNKTVMVTIPRLGTKKFAREFVASRKSWLEKQWRILEARRAPPQVLRPGMEILLGKAGRSCWNCGSTGRIGNCSSARSGRPWPTPPAICARPWRTICATPPGPIGAPGAGTGPGTSLDVKHIVIRNQRSRWGSCSCNGTISLNWRLIQLPDHVRDYIIIHELMHLRELNHSPRFWQEVEKACPDYRAAEEWLKQNSGQVGF